MKFEVICVFIVFFPPFFFMVLSPMGAGLRQLRGLFLWMGGPGCRGEYYLVIFVFLCFFFLHFLFKFVLETVGLC